MNTRHASGGNVRPIRFQPALPQPAHRGRSLLAWGVPTAIMEVLAIVGLVAITANADTVEPDEVERVHIVEMPTEVPLPEAPPPPEVPQPTPAQSEALPEVVGFQELALPTVVLKDIPPPTLDAPVFDPADFTGEGTPGGRALTPSEPRDPVEAGPTFTPYTVAPFLRNAESVTRTLAREYPSQLRSSGIGGRVLLWLFIDENGRVRDSQVKESSGFDALDQAAMRVAMTMEFSPAINRDQKVPVWVAVPVDFEVN